MYTAISQTIGKFIQNTRADFLPIHEHTACSDKHCTIGLLPSYTLRAITTQWFSTGCELGDSTNKLVTTTVYDVVIFLVN